MKINTREKLQILMFGLNAGNNLEVFYLQRIDKCAIFSDLIEFSKFYIAEDGEITCDREGCENYEDYYKMLGCIHDSKAQANELFLKIK